ncbi:MULTISPECIES: radical SAM protein [Acidobacterium]|nr:MULTISPECIES: radical SAM protein [Acidobacterium]
MSLHVPGMYLPRVWMGSQFASGLLPKEIRPLSAHIKLTENCQARCISCDYWKTHWKDGLNTARAIALIDEIHDLSIGSLRFTGGEPLLRKDFFEVLERSQARRFKKIVLQTNGLLLERFHEKVNASPITHINVSIDGMRESNDRIRGIDGYFDQAIRGIRLLKDKKIGFSVTLNGVSAAELRELAKMARDLGAELGFNILSRNLFFLANADLVSLWPEKDRVGEIESFVREEMQRPGFEVDYIRDYYSGAQLDEPACVLGYLQVFILSNGDVLTGCYPLPPVGNVVQSSLKEILHSEAYRRQAEAMVRRECPGCTCGVESSLAMKHAFASGFYELSRLLPKAG